MSTTQPGPDAASRETDTVARYLLPYPLAALYQMVLVQHEPAERRTALARLAEGLVRFLTCLGMADAAGCGADATTLRLWLEGLGAEHLEHQQHLLQAVLAFLERQEDVFLPDLLGFKEADLEETIGRIAGQARSSAPLSGAGLDQLHLDLRFVLSRARFLRRIRLGTSHHPRRAGSEHFVNHWRGSRGQEEERTSLPLRCAVRLPEDTVLVLDPGQDRGLVVGPFLHRATDRRRGYLLWLDRVSGDEAPYRHPVLDIVQTQALPDPEDPDGPGIPVSKWLGRAATWHHPFELGMDPASSRALRGVTTPHTFEDRYTFVGKIGEGAMGTVWEVENRALRRRAALKILKKEHLTSSTQLHRFRREAELLSKMAHPGVVRVHTMGVGADGEPFIEMDLLDGEPLNRRLERCGPQSAEEATVVTSRLLDALEYVHRQGVVHRDLKPSNVILCADGPRLVDFGIAAVLDGTKLTETVSVLGTLNYMAPEQWSGKATARSDLYAVGRILYQMLAGSPPEGLDADLAEVEGATDHLVDVYERATAARAGERYETAAAMRDHLLHPALPPGRALGRSDRASARAPGPVDAARPLRRTLLLGSAAGLLLLSGLLAGRLVRPEGDSAPPPATAATPSRPSSRTILVVESYHAGFSWDASYRRGLEHVLGSSRPIEYFQLDTKRRLEEDHPERVAAALRRYERLRPRLVILGDDNALKYLAPRLTQDGVPVVYLGINADPDTYIPHGATNFAGVLERPPLTSAIDGIQRLLPKPPRKILILFDSGTTSQAAVSETFGGQTRLEVLGTLADLRLIRDLHTWKTTILEAEAEGYEAILIGLYHLLEDKAGAIVPPLEVLRWTSKNTPVPPFSLWDFSVGPDLALGGRVLTGVEQGTEAGRIALEILDGARPASIPRRSVSRGRLVLSRHQLERWNLVLPSDLEAEVELRD